MRIGQLADLSGTTTRAIRHYHRIGVLAEPRRRANGYREYELADLVRLLRIRWLVGTGMPLRLVAEALSGETDGLRADATDLLHALDAELARLTDRRRRLAALLDSHDAGRPLSCLPPRLQDAFDRLSEAVAASSQRTPAPAAVELLERERQALELAVLSGQVSDDVLDHLTAVYDAIAADPEHLVAAMTALARFGALAGRDPGAADVRAEIAEVAELLDGLGRLSHLLGGPSSVPSDRGGPDPRDLSRMLAPDPAQRACLEQTARRAGYHGTFL